MKCCNCCVSFPDNWEPHHMLRNDRGTSWAYRTAECPKCKELTVEVCQTDKLGELRSGWFSVSLADATDRVPLRPTASNVRRLLS